MGCLYDVGMVMCKIITVSAYSGLLRQAYVRMRTPIVEITHATGSHSSTINCNCIPPVMITQTNFSHSTLCCCCNWCGC